MRFQLLTLLVLVAACGRINYDSIAEAELSIDASADDASETTITIIEIATGGLHTCALVSDGSVYCWGHNGEGQLGDGTFENKSVATRVSDIDDAVEVKAGSRHTCARLSTNALRCWGYNEFGQLGNGLLENESRPIDPGVDGDSLALGFGHSCVLQGGTMMCWGRNVDGQLGDGTTVRRPAPTQVGGFTNGAEIAAGRDFSCARLRTGKVSCFGLNSDGQLGKGDNLQASSPTTIAGVNSASHIALGRWHACALEDAGQIKCWGRNGLGQLGDGTTMSKNDPVDSSGVPESVAELAPGRDHTCVLGTSGQVYCWGSNQFNLVVDSTDGGVMDWRARPGVDTAVELSSGSYHSCARMLSGEVLCWGSNADGQLGQGNESTTGPVLAVSGLPTSL